jgi:dipeptidase E
MRLLLLSNSTNYGSGYLDHAIDEVLHHLTGVSRLLFVPFALHDHAGYAARVRDRLGRCGIAVDALTLDARGTSALSEAQAVFVGGGNTFRLLDRLQRGGLVEPLRARVRDGLPYMGASAGSNIAAPTLMTTNDMPIVQPASFEALGLVPFQINPHYVDPEPASRHMGETREDRLREYLEENSFPVLGMREGGWLRRDGDTLRLGGPPCARLFRPGAPPEELPAGSDLSFLL